MCRALPHPHTVESLPFPPSFNHRYKRAKYVQLVHDDSTNRLLRSSMGSSKDAETAGFAQGAGGADDAAAEAGTYGALHDTREPVN